MKIEEMLQDYRDAHEIGRLDMFEELADRYYEQRAELSALRARVEAHANKLLGLALSFNEDDHWIFERYGGVDIVSNAQAFLNPKT